VTYVPDISVPVDLAGKAISLLQQQPLAEDALREARQLFARASANVPYLGEARHCTEFRKNTHSVTCSDRLCGRCTQFDVARANQ
jgi:hypothetical protein